MPKLKGFTLIELLIVVLIIAILAAIAVPNFLEFQTRAKVARVKSDQRTIATTVEAYAVDWGVTPIGIRESIVWQPTHFGVGIDRSMILVFARMTTPIAYLSTPPLDVFSKGDQITQTSTPTTNIYAGKLYAYNSIRINSLQGRPMSGGNPSLYHQAYGRGAHWMIHGLGPTDDFSPDNRGKQIIRVPARLPSTGSAMGYPDLIYDPTNGTSSFGYIIRDSFQVY